jgi:hypothetical protein
MLRPYERRLWEDYEASVLECGRLTSIHDSLRTVGYLIHD